MTLRNKIDAAVDATKTILFNIFAPNLTKHILERYWSLYDALRERDEEYETDVNDAWERIGELEAENAKLKAELEK